LLLQLNGQWSPWWDRFWLWVTDQHHWWWLYLLIIVWVAYKLPIRQAILLIVLLIFFLILNDQLINFIKELTGRLRPCNRPDLQAALHVLKCTPQPSFFSGHAANSFLVAAGLYYAVKESFPAWWWYLLFGWAGMMAYSRIYVGVHFPGDVLAGIAEGIIMGRLFAGLYRRWRDKII